MLVRVDEWSELDGCLEALVEAEAAWIRTIQSGIFSEDTVGLAVHSRAGFRVIGTRELIGRHHGVWRDTSSSNAAAPTSTDRRLSRSRRE